MRAYFGLLFLAPALPCAGECAGFGLPCAAGLASALSFFAPEPCSGLGSAVRGKRLGSGLGLRLVRVQIRVMIRVRVSVRVGVRVKVS